MKLPKVSIITVVFNGADVVEGTILSVLGQTYSNIEYIIVDGGSSDATVDIIKQYSHRITKWISEPDKGIYDAMNKGLDLATGDFVWFMNVGDHIYQPDTLATIIKAMPSGADILYGDVMYVDSKREHLGTRSELTTQTVPEQLHWKKYKYGMCVPHQGILVSRHIAPHYIDNNLSADIDWVIRSTKKANKPFFTGAILAEFLEGGVSSQQRKRAWIDRYAILRKHFGLLPNIWNHVFISFRAILDKVR